MALYTDDLLAKIEPEAVALHLTYCMGFSQKRWQYRSPGGDDLAFAFYHRKKRITIVVPTKFASDWRIRLAETIEEIARIEDRSSFYVISDILSNKTQIPLRQAL